MKHTRPPLPERLRVAADWLMREDEAEFRQTCDEAADEVERLEAVQQAAAAIMGTSRTNQDAVIISREGFAALGDALARYYEHGEEIDDSGEV